MYFSLKWFSRKETCRQIAEYETAEVDRTVAHHPYRFSGDDQNEHEGNWNAKLLETKNAPQQKQKRSCFFQDANSADVYRYLIALELIVVFAGRFFQKNRNFD